MGSSSGQKLKAGVPFDGADGSLISFELPMDKKRVTAHVQMAATRGQVPSVASGLGLRAPGPCDEFKGAKSAKLESGKRNFWRRFDKPDGVASSVGVAGKACKVPGGA